MAYSKTLPRLIAFTALTGISVMGQSGIAHACETGKPVDTKSPTKTSADKHDKKIDALLVKYSTADTSTKSTACDATKVNFYGVSYTINGKSGFANMSTVKAGDTVKVDFTVADGCTEELTLASYSAPGATFDSKTADQQVLSNYDTGKFGAGPHSLTVKAPDCFYQLDFVHGPVITKLSSTNLYGSRIISSVNGGAACVTPPPPVTPPKVTPPPVVVTPPTPVAPVVTHVQAETLAHTGANTGTEIGLAAGLTLAGLALAGAGSRVSRRENYVGRHFRVQTIN